MIYLSLLWNFMKVGLFSFGGGYAALPLVQQVVLDNGWLTLQEFADVVSISQMTPGPIALNAASFVGTRVAGMLGAVVATVGNVLPSLCIVLVLAWVYFRYKNLKIMQGALTGLRPAVVALIASAGISLVVIALFGSSQVINFDSLSFVALALFIIGLLVIRIWKISPLLIIAGSGVVGIILHVLGIPL